MEGNRRKIGSTLFKGMMALGAAHDLSIVTSTVGEVLKGGLTSSSAELLPEKQVTGGEISFAGGAGISNIKHSRGHWMVSDGKRMVEEGKRMKRRGSGTIYDPILIRNGQDLIKKGEEMIRKGSALIKE